MSRHRALLGAGLVAVMALAGCTVGSGESEAVPEASGAGAGTTGRAEPAEAAPSPSATVGEQVSAEECRPGPGRTVTELPDVEVPAQGIPEVRGPGGEIGEEAVVVVPSATIPAQVADAGCTVEYEAPGGCLGALEISSAAIPAVTIPERVLPEVTLPDGTVLPEEVLPAQTAPAEVVEGGRQEQVCQRDEGQVRPTVVRPTLVRASIVRSTVVQQTVVRPTRCLDDGCVDGVVVEGSTVDGVVLDGVVLDGAVIDGRVLDSSADVAVLPEPDRTSYVAPGDVLFDFDRSEVRSDAAAALSAIAADIAVTAPAGAIVVEGHTDDRGEDAYNLDLSQRRAESVVEWLATQGGLDRARLTAAGLGEDAPAAPNDSDEGRQRNRRVVVTVTAP